MFSGGYDSLAATHYAMEKLNCDVVLHIDTETGIPENQRFVEHTCDLFDWPLEIITPNKTLVEFAKEHGFPKAPAHSWIYRYLKEHPLSRFVTKLEPEKPHFYTGVRKQESDRRMENVTAEQQEGVMERFWWEAPIAEWSNEDVADYIVEKGLPRNPVVETIGRSGECFCGAYADRFSELLTLKEHYPDHYEWVMQVEQEVQCEIGDEEDYCYWGSSGMSSDELQELMESQDNDVGMTMCADCDGGGHRTLGHEQDPTYETVYLAGPTSNGENPYEWHESVIQYDETVNWINPFELNDYTAEQARNHKAEIFGQDCDAVRTSDVVFLRRISGYNLCGASIEAAVAMEHGVPVVVWNDAEDDVPLMLSALATEVHESQQAAIQSALAYGRKQARHRGEQVLVR
jgi:3'-phosphoadenosine 5'-phosphosulfate sulfotransferase (PAPS reductase)/FAD synthetase